MNFLSWFQAPKTQVPEVKAEKVLTKRRMQLSEALIERCNMMSKAAAANPRMPAFPDMPILPYTPPKGVCPASHVLAMDAPISSMYNSAQGIMFSGMGFPGFPYLTELTQVTEYRDMSERVAAEMTRKWIRLRSVSKQDKSQNILKIEAELKRIQARDTFRRAAETDGYMGRAQIFIDLGESEGEELGSPLLMNKFKIREGSLCGIKLVEPITTYPYQYNSSNPLVANYYKPDTWYVFGQKVHSSRLMTFVSRPLPDLLKPTYNFSGMSLSQLAQPYVDYWLSTRDSVGKLLRNFSTSVLQTNMADTLTGGGGDVLLERARMFTQFRDNQGLFVLDKDSENFIQVNTPLSGLDKLQAQAQEHMAAVAKTPLTILLGISPTGLNASSEGEIRVFYDYVADQQEKLFRPNLEHLIKVIQLSLFGEVDEDITFDFVSLFAMTAKELAGIRKSDCEAAVAYITAGVVSAEEERARIATDPESGYDNLDVSAGLETPPSTAPGIPATEPKSGGPLQTGSEESPEDGPGRAGTAPGDSGRPLLDASVLMADAVDLGAPYERLARRFTGNQHTGGMGGRNEHPYAAATKASSFARKATSAANRIGTKAANETALKAHIRALEAHQRALPTAHADVAPIHQAFIEAHQACKTAHQLAINPEAEQ